MLPKRNRTKIAQRAGADPFLYEMLRDIWLFHDQVVIEVNDILSTLGLKVDGSGTPNYLPAWTAVRTLADSPAYTDGASLFTTNDLIVGKSVLGVQGARLIESAATGFVTVAVPADGFISGECLYAVLASDTTVDVQARSGRLRFVAVSKAGTVTVSINDIGSQEIAASTGALTAAFSATTASGEFTLACTAVSSLAQTLLRVYYRLDVLASSATITGL